MLLLNIFCAECTPYLLLMLAGAWGLGWLFWKLFKESGYLETIKRMGAEISAFKKENLDLKTEITQAHYEVDKSGKELTKLRHKIGDFELQGRVSEEKLQALQDEYEQLKKDFQALKS
jgi:predicted  nucleic acid-binding Zn-ribbon protein